ncbi:MAG: hypothetical protein ACM3ML_37005 [Micromonosporaceae bacterium]
MEPDTHYNSDQVVARVEISRPSGGIYSLPVVGNAAARARQFYEEMAPKETDSTEVRVAKEVFRWSSAAAGAAAVAVVVLGEPDRSAREAGRAGCTAAHPSAGCAPL